MDLFIGGNRMFPSCTHRTDGWNVTEPSTHIGPEAERPVSDHRLRLWRRRIAVGVSDLRGRVPVQIADPVANGVKYDVGLVGGQAHVQLLPENMPQHTHILQALNSTASQHPPTNGLPAIPKPAKGVTATEINIYGSAHLAKPISPLSPLPASCPPGAPASPKYPASMP